MIQANELRIGNWVNNPIDDVIQVTIIDILNIDHKESYDPVEITEEWLVKFGFEKSIGNGLNFYAIKTPPSGYFYLDLKFQPIITIGRKKEYLYIHELQNLYFALTGKELAYS